MAEAAKLLTADIETLAEMMHVFAKDLAPPPPKFGDIPATGNNADSIDYSVDSTRGGATAQVFTQSGYGGWLEIGTSRMAARPYFAPAFQQAKDAMR
jgi:HK97 gp10 family phage protein